MFITSFTAYGIRNDDATMLTFLMPSSTASSSPLTTEMSRHRFCFFLTSRRCHEKSRYRSRLFLAHRRCRERPFAVTKIRSICILPYQLGPSLRMHCFAFLFKQTWTHPEIRGQKLPEIVVSPKDPEIGRAPRLSATARPRQPYSSIFSGFASTASLLFF